MTTVPQQELAARDSGMEEAAQAKRETLKLARSLAKDSAEGNGSVTIDEVHYRLRDLGLPLGALGNASGSVFKGPEWQCIGFKASTRKGRHGSAIRIWKLKP